MSAQEFDLPSMRKKQDAAAATDVDLETVKHFWLVPNMFTFENIGFTHTVGDIKYLACADCDVGPIGWSDTKSQQSYIALNRVRYLP
ncbi:hypothetical protein B566_EDAN001310 [Ephemera danica]|nr:hypothetical protein B566_EDAN001310 [Ephemera danica]